MLLLALVLFRQSFFQPVRLLLCSPLVYRLWIVADEELLAATVTPERSHLLEACCCLAATLFYRHRPHILILDYLEILLVLTSRSLTIRLVKTSNFLGTVRSEELQHDHPNLHGGITAIKSDEYLTPMRTVAISHQRSTPGNKSAYAYVGLRAIRHIS